jgi:hypothetical protein
MHGTIAMFMHMAAILRGSWISLLYFGDPALRTRQFTGQATAPCVLMLHDSDRYQHAHEREQ